MTWSSKEEFSMTLLEWCEANEGIDKQGEHIIKQWTGIDEYGNTIDIKNIAAKSGKKLLWRCSKEHTWIAKVTSSFTLHCQSSQLGVITTFTIFCAGCASTDVLLQTNENNTHNKNKNFFMIR